MNRGVAVGTVRAQIKTIFSKIGVSRQIEVAARVNQL
jgi:DNA-binding NarL/FixJ family response regulator